MLFHKLSQNSSFHKNFLEKCHTEFNEKNDLVADTRSRTNRRTDLIDILRRSFSFREERLITEL
jgi:hypothetical protein